MRHRQWWGIFYHSSSNCFRCLHFPSDHGNWTFFFLTLFSCLLNFFYPVLQNFQASSMNYCYYIVITSIFWLLNPGSQGSLGLSQLSKAHRQCTSWTGHQPVTGLILITCFNSLFLDDRVSCTRGSKAMLNHDSPFILGFMVLILVMVCTVFCPSKHI